MRKIKCELCGGTEFNLVKESGDSVFIKEGKTKVMLKCAKAECGYCILDIILTFFEK